MNVVSTRSRSTEADVDLTGQPFDHKAAPAHWRPRKECQMRFLSMIAAFCLVFASAGVLPYAADGPQPKNSSDPVTVRGCLQGLVLTTQDESGTNLPTPHKFEVTDRRMLKTLKMHSGHFEELTGVVKSGKSRGGFAVSEKPIKKGRVYIGAGSAPVYEANPIPDSSIEVRGFTHIRERCS